MNQLYRLPCDVENFDMAACRSEVTRTLPYDLGSRLFDSEPMTEGWTPLPFTWSESGSGEIDFPKADFSSHIPGRGFVVSSRVVSLPDAEKMIKRCAELLPITVSGEPAWLLHFAELDPAQIDDKRSRYDILGGVTKYYSRVVLKKGAKPSGWLFRVNGTIYTCGTGTGTFHEFYHQHQLTGLIFEPVPPGSA